MTLLVFSSVCALCRGSSILFPCRLSNLFSGLHSNPAARSLIQPFVHILCGPPSTIDVHQNMSCEREREPFHQQIVFPFSLPLIIFKLGRRRGLWTCPAPLSRWGHSCLSKGHTHALGTQMHILGQLYVCEFSYLADRTNGKLPAFHQTVCIIRPITNVFY